MPGMSVAKSLHQMPEAFVSDKTITRQVSRMVKAGKLRKLASRLYTRDLTDRPEAVVARNLWQIVAGFFPGALIADRTALENAPATMVRSAWLLIAEETFTCPATSSGHGEARGRFLRTGPSSRNCS